MKAHVIYRTILIAASMLADLRPARGTPEAGLLAALYPALRQYEDDTDDHPDQHPRTSRGHEGTANE